MSQKAEIRDQWVEVGEQSSNYRTTITNHQLPATTTNCRLFIKRLHLTNFRNYDFIDLAIEPQSIVITGVNGSGKTNLLEAISLLAAGKGIRNAKLSEISRRSGGTEYPWSVFSVISTPQGEISIGTGISDDDKRIIKINGEVKRGQSELAEHFSVCYLTPRMDQTFVDGTTSRRDFLDSLSGIFYPEHIKHLSIYQHSKSERQKLLYLRNADEVWLAALEHKMAEQAVAIADARIETINRLQNEINNRDSVFPKAILGIIGEVEELLQAMSALRAEEDFKQKLASTRKQDAESGKTVCGVHRSDFTVVHGDKKLKAEMCSTGEQKALLLSITLAVVRAHKRWSGSAPVLLLDEVVAHLDKDKRIALFHELEELQVQSWLTGTDISFFYELQNNAQFLSLDRGMLQHEKLNLIR